MGPSDAIRVFGDSLDANGPEQVGPEGHDVAACIERLGVRVQRDDGRVVRGKRVDESVSINQPFIVLTETKFIVQARLVHHLSFQAGCRPWGMVAPEGVVQDQRPAGGAFLVLPQPGRKSVKIQ